MRKLTGMATPVVLCFLMLCIAKALSYYTFGLSSIPGSWIIVMAIISLFVFIVDCALPADIAVDAIADDISEAVEGQFSE